MTATVILKDTLREHGGNGDGGEPEPSYADGPQRKRSSSAAGIALWFFIGVASVLFFLFVVSYAMRMDAADWSPITMPRQLWLSTTLLFAGSLMLDQASTAARVSMWRRAHTLLIVGGMCALFFLVVQLWAWQTLLDEDVMPVGNPAASFFYLLTAMHGLHVAGGLLAWVLTAHHMSRECAPSDPLRTVRTISLCARYWHFLLAIWLLLFATLGWLTPDIVRFICGTR